MPTNVNTDKAPGAIGPYSQAMQIAGLLFTSGQLPINPASGEMPKDIAGQTRQSLENVKAILKEAGSHMNNVIKTTVFLSDMANFAAMNEIYAEYFNDPFPARSCFQVARLPKDALVEIEVIAEK